MKEEKLEELLSELGRRETEPVHPALGKQIKQQIPDRLTRHRIGWDTVNIIIDLRMSKSVAAAVIIITMILLVNLFGDRDSAGRGIFQDAVLLIKYWGSSGENDVSAGRSKYEHLLHRGEDVTWYGDQIDPKDSKAVVMLQRMPDERYVVTFVDNSEREVSSEVLIKLLTRMLHNKAK
ncbi:MAG: hypothetical protein ACYTFW_02260 [Planctomycetota bacterium]|jgi:hypothetical protein